MSGVARQATYSLAYEELPCLSAAGGRTWIVRGANFAVAYSELEPSSALARDHQADEYMLIVPLGVTVEMETDGAKTTLQGGALAIVPPGRSVVTATTAGFVARIFSSAASDILGEASNTLAYEGVQDVAPLGDGAPPTGGYRLRTYRFDDYAEATAGKPFLLFRSQHLMANVFKPFVRPRDTSKLSPHHHDDFEQCSLALSGEWVHRLRYPWGPDLAAWRPDETLAMGSPSMLIIPPRVIHTTYVTSPDGGWLVDIFAPARADFLEKPGMLLNAEDYPSQRPAGAEAA